MSDTPLLARLLKAAEEHEVEAKDDGEFSFRNGEHRRSVLFLWDDHYIGSYSSFHSTKTGEKWETLVLNYAEERWDGEEYYFDDVPREALPFFKAVVPSVQWLYDEAEDQIFWSCDEEVWNKCINMTYTNHRTWTVDG